MIKFIYAIRKSLFVLSMLCICMNAVAINVDDNFSNKVKKIVADKFQNDDLSFSISFDSSDKVNYINNRLSDIKNMELLSFSTLTNSFKIRVYLPEDNNIDIFAKYEAYFDVPITTRWIKASEIVSEQDVKFMRYSKLQKYGEIALHTTQLVGYQTKRDIPAGKMIMLSDLKKSEASIVIKEDDIVDLVYDSGGLFIKTTGIALSNGRVGEKIRVKNEKTNVIVSGGIRDNNTVIVGSSYER